MIDRIREFLSTDTGRYVGIALALVGVALALWLTIRQFGGGIAARSAQRIFIDANTGQQFSYTLTKGEMSPVPSPHSGGSNTGYEAEPCYWTKEGGAKQEPTWVLPRVKVDPQAGPTFCPDCGRLVVPRNPPAGAGTKPPPTESEYRQRRAAGSGATEGRGDRAE